MLKRVHYKLVYMVEHLSSHIKEKRYIIMNINFKYSLSRDILYIVKRYDKIDAIERLRLDSLFHKYLFQFWYNKRISASEFIMFQSLYCNLINRRLGFVSHFCEKAYYPNH